MEHCSFLLKPTTSLLCRWSGREGFSSWMQFASTVLKDHQRPNAQPARPSGMEHHLLSAPCTRTTFSQQCLVARNDSPANTVTGRSSTFPWAWITTASTVVWLYAPTARPMTITLSGPWMTHLPSRNLYVDNARHHYHDPLVSASSAQSAPFCCKFSLPFFINMHWKIYIVINIFFLLCVAYITKASALYIVTL